MTEALSKQMDSRAFAVWRNSLRAFWLGATDALQLAKT
ncbi:hypothetical protein OHAE_3729 [Ochrobactrum soli]|uniref:Uncharacterized protein n=1 Tax=Ochrobactrum soli TaxID=2448455 RepID=A0A2P9HI86_9HYPH|nr:hypothetical protein OHAE_3729 [[Ochrobactrum] soli]